MFNFECLQRKGDLIGTCIDGFLFGVCCRVPPFPADGNLEQSALAGVTISVQEILANNKLHSTTSVVSQVEDTTSKISQTTKPTKQTALVTKAKPKDSVLVYTLNVFNKEPDQSFIENSNFGSIVEIDTHGSPTDSTDPLKIKQTTARSTDSINNSSSELTTKEPLMIWTLSSRPPILNSKPIPWHSVTGDINGFPVKTKNNVGITAFMTIPKSPLESTSPISIRLPTSEETSSTDIYSMSTMHNEIKDVTETSYLLNRISNIDSSDPISFTTVQYVDGEPIFTESNEIDSTDSVQDLTTSKPSRGSALKPRPSTTELSTSNEPLLFWTTAKPSLRPRPTRFPLTTTLYQSNVTYTRPPSFLNPKPVIGDMPISTAQLIDDLIESMSATLADNQVSGLHETSTSGSDTWASSTYSIFPLEYDISQNTIDIDGPSYKPLLLPSQINSIMATTSLPMNDTPFVTTPSPVKLVTTSVFELFSEKDTLLRPATTSTEVSPSGTTPIDEFIENLFNSLMYSNTTTDPPLDIDLVQQVSIDNVIYCMYHFLF